MTKPTLSQKAERFTESVIREMTRLAQIHNAINLAQGMPDFEAPAEIKEAACRAIMGGVNQYAITWGARSFREALARNRKSAKLKMKSPSLSIPDCASWSDLMSKWWI